MKSNLSKKSSKKQSVKKSSKRQSVKKSSKRQSIKKSAKRQSIKKSTKIRSVKKNSSIKRKSIKKSAKKSVKKSAKRQSIKKSTKIRSVKKNPSIKRKSIKKSANKSVKKSAKRQSIKKSTKRRSIKKNANKRSVNKSSKRSYSKIPSESDIENVKGGIYEYLKKIQRDMIRLIGSKPTYIPWFKNWRENTQRILDGDQIYAYNTLRYTIIQSLKEDKIWKKITIDILKNSDRWVAKYVLKHLKSKNSGKIL